MNWSGPCYIVRRGQLTHPQNLAARLFAAVLLLALAGSSAARAQNLPVAIGQDYAAAVAALKTKGIDFHDEANGSSRKITYRRADETVTLDFTLWPKAPDAPASAWDSASPDGKQLALTHILDVAPSSEARRVWVRTFEKDGRRWAYMSPQANAERAAADRDKYPVAAFLQWTAPPATFVFEAARAAGSPPGTEATALDVTLDNPHKPRRFL